YNLQMEPSGSGGAPVKRSFPVGTRMAAHTISCHVCFFCGSTFPQWPDYQRHIVHEHQMASVSYQLYAAEHPPPNKGGGKKRGMEEEKKKEEKGEKGGVGGEEKKTKRDPPPSLPSPTPAPIRHPTITALPQQPKPISAPLLPPGRYPANKQQTQQRQSTAAEGSSKGSTEDVVRKAPMDAPCAMCRERFQNSTDLVIHKIHKHQAVVTEVLITQHFGDTDIPDQKYVFSDVCAHCDVETPNLTESFEHFILNHRGQGFKGKASEATSVTYLVTISAEPSYVVNIKIKHKRMAPLPFN
ncbi:hypothetical protein PENTCL1PPCAC_10791, partial [Pristionchus entomophagus]